MRVGGATCSTVALQAFRTPFSAQHSAEAVDSGGRSMVYHRMCQKIWLDVLFRVIRVDAVRVLVGFLLKAVLKLVRASKKRRPPFDNLHAPIRHP